MTVVVVFNVLHVTHTDNADLERHTIKHRTIVLCTAGAGAHGLGRRSSLLQETEATGQLLWSREWQGGCRAVVFACHRYLYALQITFN